MATTVPWRGSWWINIYRSRMEKETIYWKSLRTDQQDGKSPCSKEFYARNLDTENPNLVKITHTHTHTHTMHTGNSHSWKHIERKGLWFTTYFHWNCPLHSSVWERVLGIGKGAGEGVVWTTLCWKQRSLNKKEEKPWVDWPSVSPGRHLPKRASLLVETVSPLPQLLTWCSLALPWAGAPLGFFNSSPFC